MIEHVPAAVLECWRGYVDAGIEPVRSGLINDTFLVRPADGERAILQRLHRVFPAQVNTDIAAVTARLKAANVPTPQLIPTIAGTLWTEHDGRIWRALTCLPGQSRHRLESPQEAESAGALVGRFHAALDGFDYVYQAQRADVHVTSRHLTRLRGTLEGQADHPLYTDVFQRAQPLLEARLPIPATAALPLRHAHGDLKVSNILFTGQVAVGLIDLDTVGRMAWPFELGDALRSWCNPRAEDAAGAALDLQLLDAALRGYATAGMRIEAQEKAALIGGIAQIALELAVRFLSDALEESYFGWEPARYRTRGAHNLARGRAMAQLYDSVIEQRAEAERIVRHRLN